MEVNIAMATGEKKCKYCGSKESSFAVSEEGNTYQRRTTNPYVEDSWICGKMLQKPFVSESPSSNFCS